MNQINERDGRLQWRIEAGLIGNHSQSIVDYFKDYFSLSAQELGLNYIVFFFKANNKLDSFCTNRKYQRGRRVSWETTEQRNERPSDVPKEMFSKERV